MLVSSMLLRAGFSAFRKQAKLVAANHAAFPTFDSCEGIANAVEDAILLAKASKETACYEPRGA